MLEGRDVRCREQVDLPDLDQYPRFSAFCPSRLVLGRFEEQIRDAMRGVSGGTISFLIPKNYPSTAHISFADREASPWGSRQPAGSLHRRLPFLPINQCFLGAHIPECGHLRPVNP